MYVCLCASCVCVVEVLLHQCLLSTLCYRYDTSPKYSILKRGQSVFLESNLENIGSPLKSGKPKLSQQFKFDSVEDNDERALPNEDKEDQSGSSVKGIRPTLLSVMIGVHWKHSIKKGLCVISTVVLLVIVRGPKIHTTKE